MTTQSHRHLTVLAAAAGLMLLSLPACTDDGDDAGSDTQTEDSGTEGDTEDSGTEDSGTETGDDMSLEIVGSYMDNFGDTHTITESEWQNGAGSFAISEYDNAAMYLIAQNAGTNEFSPDLWSRFDWAWDAEQLYYCQSVFDGATPEDALAGSADAADLEMGCGGFAWSMLTPLSP